MGIILYVFSQNTKLESFKRISGSLPTNKKTVMLTSHKLFENEREFLKSIFSTMIDNGFVKAIFSREMI